MSAPLRIGLVAAARITEPALVAPAAQRDDVELTAVAARDPGRARDAARRWGVANVHPTYAELLADDRLDAVYVATPAAHHRDVTTAALEAGRHVLCEKPIGSNADDARAMVQAADRTGFVLMEAFHWRYHPWVDEVRQLLDDGEIGRITHVAGRFDVPDGQIARDDIRWQLELGGGALMDLGCYPVQWVRWAVGDEPDVVSARADATDDGVDGSMHVELRWPDGTTGTIDCSMTAAADRRDASLRIDGTDGSVTVENALAPQSGGDVVVTTGHGDRRLDVARTTTYSHQLDAFVRAVRDGEPPPTSGTDTIATMELIDAIYRAAGLEPRPSVA